MKYLFLLCALISSAFATSPLYLAVESQNLKAVKKEIAKGAELERKEKGEFTPLYMAAGLDNKQIVVELVKAGADINAETSLGISVIHRAAMSRNTSILKYLIEMGADIHKETKQLCTPLDSSLRNNTLQNYGDLDNAKLLLEYGAISDINKKCNGFTPLMVSVTNRKAVMFLLANGADTRIKTRAGETALDLARKYKAGPLIIRELEKRAGQAPKSVETYTNDQALRLIKLTNDDSGKLMWERKTLKNKYDNYSKEEADIYCRNLKWAGYTDWRLPTLEDYESILTYEPIIDMTIDGIPKYYMRPEHFPNLTPTRFWAKEGSEMYYVDIATKLNNKTCKSCLMNHVRCVRDR